MLRRGVHRWHARHEIRHGLVTLLPACEHEREVALQMRRPEAAQLQVIRGVRIAVLVGLLRMPAAAPQKSEAGARVPLGKFAYLRRCTDWHQQREDGRRQDELPHDCLLLRNAQGGTKQAQRVETRRSPAVPMAFSEALAFRSAAWIAPAMWGAII